MDVDENLSLDSMDAIIKRSFISTRRNDDTTLNENDIKKYSGTITALQNSFNQIYSHTNNILKIEKASQQYNERTQKEIQQESTRLATVTSPGSDLGTLPDSLTSLLKTIDDVTKKLEDLDLSKGQPGTTGKPTPRKPTSGKPTPGRGRGAVIKAALTSPAAKKIAVAAAVGLGTATLMRAVTAGGDLSQGKPKTTVIGNQIRTGGTIAWRNNNPGNMVFKKGEFAERHGAIGYTISEDGNKTAVFRTIEEGMAANRALLKSGGYKNLTIDQSANRWTKNNARGTGYAKALADAAGVGLNTKIGDLSAQQLSALINAKAKQEGFRAGVVGAAGGVTQTYNTVVDSVKKVTARITGKPTDVLTFTAATGSYANFTKINLDLQKAVIMAATDYKKATGKKMQVNSSLRYAADQERLWAETVRRGTPGRSAGGDLVGKPPSMGKISQHIGGNAIDIQEAKSDPKRALPILAKYGLEQVLGDADLPHIEFKKGKKPINNGPTLTPPPINNGPALTPSPAVQRAPPAAAAPSLFSTGAPIVPPKAFGGPNYMAQSNPFGGTPLFNAAQQRQ